MNKVFLVIESAVRNTKQKRIPLSQWPTTSPFCCLVCFAQLDKLKVVPIPMVHINLNFQKSTLHILVDNFETGHPYPLFCSVNCLRINIEYSNLANKQRLIHNAVILQLLWRRHFAFEQQDWSLHTLPQYKLQQFGGPLTVAEFRKGFCAFLAKPAEFNQSTSIKSKVSEQDSIYWPNRHPHTLFSHTDSYSAPTQIASLTSMDDPTDILANIIQTEPVVNDDSNNNSTIQLVSDVLKSTLHHQTIQDVSNQLRRMELHGGEKGDAKEKNTMEPKEMKTQKNETRPIHEKRLSTIDPTNDLPKHRSKRQKKTMSPLQIPSKFTQTQHPMFRSRKT